MLFLLLPAGLLLPIFEDMNYRTFGLACDGKRSVTMTYIKHYLLADVLCHS